MDVEETLPRSQSRTLRRRRGNLDRAGEDAVRFSRMPTPMEAAITTLCPQCQLCCNGVLFADVELQPGDSPDDLRHLGVRLRRKGRKSCFNQPCAQLQADGLCRIYRDRPRMCAGFECGVLLRLAAGDWTEAQAIARIRKARRLEQKVRHLLDRLGNQDVHQALTKRYQKVMEEPIDCAADRGLIEARGELMLTVQELMDLAHHDFLAVPT